MTQERVGSVVSLWRYPVKSMMGEELNACEVSERGVAGDRAFALLDAADGKVASAKNPRKWAKLFDCRAAYVEPPGAGGKTPPVRITLPDGSTVTTDRPDADRLLSRALGREARLETRAPGASVLEEFWPDVEDSKSVTDEPIAMGSPAGTFYDFAVVHLLTTATLDHLRVLYPQGRVEPRRFRPNVIVATSGGESGFVENAWVGRTVSIGDRVRLRVTDPCPRCVMTTLPQGDLPADPGILRAVARNNRVVGGDGRGRDGVYEAVIGVYASVLQGGPIRRGDAVLLE